MPEANPFLDPLRFERRPPPCSIVIFGASGDLTRRKLIPALYRLAYDRRIPPGFAILGTSRSALTDDQFRDRMRDALKEFLDEDTPFDEHLWSDFHRGLFYCAGDVHDPDSFPQLARRLHEITEQRRTEDNAIFYLSTQPSHYEAVIRGIEYAKLNRGGRGWRRVVIEKPFGQDLESARALNAAVQQVFPEKEIYRIDHYLGKETV
ncbi:MAG TPA: glucose-6-phosphate dehydrogenase, partial [Bryobacteraceae bacterium]|nr:glucose-6-phosphate dehydrogenase [Bryobacteraceae bacterium]